MAELSLRDRLQPSLLDRLTDLTPTRLNVLVTCTQGRFAELGVTEAMLITALRAVGLEPLERLEHEDGERFTLTLRAPEPFMSAAELASLPFPEAPTALEQVVEIGFRRVRVNQESRDARFMSMQRLRQSVLRDLNWLLNTGNLDNLGDTAAISAYPEVCASVVNYGIPDITGMYAQGASPELLERVIADAIRRFEPRILAHTVQVTAVLDAGKMNRRALSFVIEGQLWGQPLPEQLYLKTEVDLGNGEIMVTEADAGSES